MNINSSTLLTGSSSGLGKYLLENLNCQAFDRENLNKKYKDIRTIIHCGWDDDLVLEDMEYLSYSNLIFDKLASLRPKKFVFFSSISVYPKFTKELLDENLIIDLREVTGISAISKVFIENRIRNQIPNHLIIRSSTLIGKYSQNSIIKLLRNQKISLSKNSEMNIIRYEHVLEFLSKSQNLQGTFNLVSKKNIKILKINKNLSLFGYYEYNCGYLNSKKINTVIDTKTSEENYKI